MIRDETFLDILGGFSFLLGAMVLSGNWIPDAAANARVEFGAALILAGLAAVGGQRVLKSYFENR